MKPFDERRIDPTPEELVRLLVAATRRANGRTPQPTLGRGRDQWERFVRLQGKKREGRRAFLGRGGPAPRVEASWWTDRIGRRHWRVVGRRVEVTPRCGRGQQREFAAYPLWHVYPDRLALRQAGARRELLTACPCGVSGPPEEVGWDGERCGPCHDRLEEGLPSLPAALPTALDLPGGEISEMAFCGDSHLVTADARGRVLAWGLEDGSCHTLRRRGAEVQALAVSAAGQVALSSADNRVLLGNLGGDRWRTVRVPAGQIFEFQFTPGGDRLAARGDLGVFLIDPRDEAAAPARVLAWEVDTWLFLPDGSGSLLEENFEWGVGRFSFDAGPQEPDGMGRPAGEGIAWLDENYGNNELDVPQMLAVSPDGRWVAINSGWKRSPGVHVCGVAGGAWKPLVDGVKAGKLASFEFTADSKLAVASEDGTLGLWDPATQAPLGKLHVAAMAGRSGPSLFSASGELFAFADESGRLTVWPWRRMLTGEPRTK